MTDHDRAALDGFFAELHRVWMLAGPPTYEHFEKLSKTVKGPCGDLWLTRSTTQDILSGRRQQPPKWRWVARFITVLRVAAKEGGIPADSVGTLTEWKQKHQAVLLANMARSRLHRAAGAEALTSNTAGDHALSRARAARRPAGLLLNEADAHHDPALAALLRAVGQDWWRDCSELVPSWLGTYLSLEPAACLIRAYETTLVPGWLQTEAYAAAAIGLSWLANSQAAIGRLVELRMRRQQFLERANGPRLWAIFDESAIRREMGSAEIMRAQIRHLIAVSTQPGVTIQVRPVGTSVQAVADGPITLLRFSDPALPDVVYLEQLTGAIYLPRETDVDHYKAVFSGLGVEALGPEATRDFMSEILLEM
jgi:hypothetical protein